jgi:hypothetical protein
MMMMMMMWLFLIKRVVMLKGAVSRCRLRFDNVHARPGFFSVCVCGGGGVSVGFVGVCSCAAAFFLQIYIVEMLIYVMYSSLTTCLFPSKKTTAFERYAP